MSLTPWKPLVRYTLAVALLLVAATASAQVNLDPPREYPADRYTYALAIGDVTGDGRNDVVGVGPNFTTFVHHVYVWAQDANGDLAATPVVYTTGSSSMRPSSVSLGDVNGDGRRDVVVGSDLGDEFGVLLQQADGQLAPMTRYTTSHPYLVHVADLNSDGRDDVVTMGSTSQFHVLLQNPDGSLGTPVARAVVTGGKNEITSGDVTGDGLTDLVIMSGQGYAEPNVTVVPQMPDGTLGAAFTVDLLGNEICAGVGIGDVNGDGANDIVLSVSRDGVKQVVRLLQDSGAFIIQRFPTYNGNGALEVADMDGDGRDDVVVFHDSWHQIGIYLQTANGGLGPETLYPVPNYGTSNPQAMAVGDVNGDGRPDVAVNQFDSPLNGIRVYRQRDTVPPVVTLVQPGTSIAGVPVSLSWTATDDVGFGGFDVEVSGDAGQSWTAVGGCTGLPAEARECTWTPARPAWPTTRLRLTGRDSSGNVAVDERDVMVVNNGVPVVDPGGPYSGVRGQAISFSASGSDPDGHALSYSWSFDDGGVASGATVQHEFSTLGGHQATVTATDGLDAVSATAPVTITNVAPTVALSSPAPGSLFTAPATVALSASAADVDGAIVGVEFYEGDQFLGSASAAPFTFVWGGVGAGVHTVRARALDSDGGATVSDTVTFKVRSIHAAAADAHVEDGGGAKKNFGTAASLEVQTGGSGHNRWTYLKFDLAAVTSITGGRLRLHGRLSATTATPVVTQVFGSTNVSWTETGLTWNTKPATAASALAAVAIANDTTAAQWYEWDVTGWLQQEKAAGHTTVTLVLKNQAASNPYALFNSRQAATLRPELVVTP